MEKRHRCKLCFRNFANGRALGGHMRSHMMKFYAAEKVSEEDEEHAFDDFQSVHSYSSSPSSLSSSSDDDEEEEGIPEESALLVDHDFAAAAAVSASAGESETESFRKNVPICRRSKRVRKSRLSDLDRFGFFHVKKPKFEGEYYSPEPMSSVSDTTPEEHLAHCLIMLSRDTWQREDQEEEEEEYSGVEKVVIKTDKVVRGKYRCEECNKLFRSYQALGGHRASHKKIKPNAPPPPPRKVVVANAPPVKKVHECPFCHRIFSSGQALGGHKRTHFIVGAGAVSSANVVTAAAFRQDKQTSRTGDQKLNIDLNLPAPVDDDDDVSQVAVSAVSDEEFVHPIMQRR